MYSRSRSPAVPFPAWRDRPAPRAMAASSKRRARLAVADQSKRRQSLNSKRHRPLPVRRNRQDRAVRRRRRFRPFADAPPLREHAAKDCDAAVASRIGRVQRAADCDGDVVAEGNMSAESSENNDLPGRCGPPDVKPPPPGAAPLATLWTKTG